MKYKLIFTILIVSIFLMSSIEAYHPGTGTSPVQQQSNELENPGNTMLYVSIGVILTLAGLAYWKIKYAPDK